MFHGFPFGHGQQKDTEFYDLLELKPDASPDDIKRNYKKLAMKYHPDKNKNKENVTEMETKFKKINEAYETLNDPEKKQLYDQFGKQALNGNQEMPDINNIFGQMFGGNPFGGPSFGNPFNQNQNKFSMPSVEKKINLKLVDIFKEKTIKIQITRYNLKSNTKLQDIKCSECKGEGYKTVIMQMGPMIQQSRGPCDRCKSKGINLNYFTEESVDLDITINPGVVTGQKITIRNQGNQIPEQDKRGDVILICNVENEGVINGFKYTRTINNNPSDIKLDLEIHIGEAICGSVKKITLLDGREVNIQIPENSHIKDKQNNINIIVVPNYGVPIYDKPDYGDLFIFLSFLPVTNIDKTKLFELFGLEEYKDQDNFIKTIKLENYKN